MAPLLMLEAPRVMARRIAVAAIVWPLVGCAPVNSQAPVLVEYHRSGGIAGRDDQLVIRSDGSARLSRRGAKVDFAIPSDTLQQLRALLKDIDFAGLRAAYLPARPGADLFEYVLVHHGRRIRTMDTAVPGELQPLIQLLSGVIGRR